MSLVNPPGGTGLTSPTTGSLLFVGATGLMQQDNANLFWDDTNNRAGINIAAPTAALHLGSDAGTAASGIKFGSTGDTSIYRSSAGILQTAGRYSALGYVVAYDGLTGQMTLGNVSGNSGMYFGIAGDTVLYRAGTAILQTNGAFILGAGIATAGGAPLKFTSGTNLTTAAAGAMEYNGTNLFFTRTGTTRENVLVGNDAASAPSTSNIGVILDYYGTSSTRVLTTPNSWAGVNIGGTAYKIPLYT